MLLKLIFQSLYGFIKPIWIENEDDLKKLCPIIHGFSLNRFYPKENSSDFRVNIDLVFRYSQEEDLEWIKSAKETLLTIMPKIVNQTNSAFHNLSLTANVWLLPRNFNLAFDYRRRAYSGYGNPIKDMIILAKYTRFIPKIYPYWIHEILHTTKPQLLNRDHAEWKVWKKLAIYK